MSRIYLPSNASRARIRDAQQARRNRAEIVRELSWGRVSRRDLLRWGLFTGAGLLAPIGGLNPFVRSASAQAAGVPRSPLFGAQPFTQAMPRVDVLTRQPIREVDGQLVSCLTPAPSRMANQTKQPVHPLLGGGEGPIEGRPPGEVWAHQRFNEYLPKVAAEAAQAPATTNYAYNAGVPSSLNSGIVSAFDGGSVPGMPVRFHPKLPIQNPNTVWTFNGTVPPKLLQARYGEPVLFRHHNRLPVDVRQNGGFGRHTISTHEHNGHHGAENDGFTGAFFFPNQYYDYHWPMVLAGCYSVNMDATDSFASSPDGSGGLIKVPGDWHETMSSHWFHDHMFEFTAQNVYKGNAAVFNIYSGLDRGNEEINDGVNLRLPSGTRKDWGNLDYDVNLLVADKAFDEDGQLFYDIFNFDGFMGDVMTVNDAYNPYFEVERRKYRFRILNAAVARFFKIALANSQGVQQSIMQIGNDGNLLPSPVVLPTLGLMGIAERFDIVIDFSSYAIGDKLHLVNLAEHFDPTDGTLNGKKVIQELSLAAALSGASADPCVGRFMEFRVVRDPARPDVSQVPTTLIPNPIHSKLPVARERRFVWGKGADENDPRARWTVSTDGGPEMGADFGRISAAPKFGTREIWHLVNDGGGWDHPIHIHFEEALILARNGSAANVPLAERGRKDVFRLDPGGSVTVSIQFRDWGGMFMEHCHNTTHEDNAMLLRWDIDSGGREPHLSPLPTPAPTPQGVTFHQTTDILPGAFSSE